MDKHLFAAGYAARFGGALDFVGKQQKRDAAKARITCAVTIGPREGGGFGIAVKMRVEDESIVQAERAALVRSIGDPSADRRSRRRLPDGSPIVRPWKRPSRSSAN